MVVEINLNGWQINQNAQSIVVAIIITVIIVLLLLLVATNVLLLLFLLLLLYIKQSNDRFLTLLNHPRGITRARGQLDFGLGFEFGIPT